MEIWSHDQGWSSCSEDHGTYRNSWTWFDLRIERAPEREDVSEDLAVRLATNMHASRVTQNHQVVYRAEDDLPWMRSLQAGDQVSIIPRALFPGWQNFVEKASIETYTDPLVTQALVVNSNILPIGFAEVGFSIDSYDIILGVGSAVKNTFKHFKRTSESNIYQ